MRKADWATYDGKTTSHVGADESEDVHRSVCTDPLYLPAGHDAQVAADDEVAPAGP